MDKTFSDLDLDPKLLATLKSIGYEKPTPIQAEAIPQAIQGRDLIASAQTGTGKTASFLLPAISAMANMPKAQPRCPTMLVLVPTRELAEQVAKEAVKFSKAFPHIFTVCIYGGMPYPIQNRNLSRPYQILVATPGRLMDHMERGRIDLSQVKYFVLDEADRMLDMGFIEAVESIAAEMPEDRQTLLFSATLNKKVLKISRDLQTDPFQITIQPDLSKQNPIEKRLYYVNDIDHKMQLLDNLLEDPEITQAIIFTSTKIQADRLADELHDKGHRTAPLHGDINQNKRNRTLNGLRKGQIKILVATDVAARGIDVTNLSHVINFDIPRHAEDFVHRIGRTGRAGSTGIAITFATYSERPFLHAINELIDEPMNVHTIEGLEPRAEPVKNKSFGGPRGGRPSFRGPRNGSGRNGGGFRGNSSQRGEFRGSRDNGSRSDRDFGSRNDRGNSPRSGDFGNKKPFVFKGRKDSDYPQKQFSPKTFKKRANAAQHSEK
jgi:superfamily II DNA/RNA helicase